MLGREQSASASLPGPGALGGVLHHPARAKRVVHLFMGGAASHVDLFDYKPQLIKRHGEASDFGEPVEAFQDGLGPWMKPVWEFQPYGQSGKHLSSVVSELGAVADEMAFVHNLVGKTGVHSMATYLQATGFQLPGFPGMGSWVSYGLGSMNETCRPSWCSPTIADTPPTDPKTGTPPSFPPNIREPSSFPEPRRPSRICFLRKTIL